MMEAVTAVRRSSRLPRRVEAVMGGILELAPGELEGLPVAVVAPTLQQFRMACHEQQVDPCRAIWISNVGAHKIRGLNALRLIWGPGWASLPTEVRALVRERVEVIRLAGRVVEVVYDDPAGPSSAATRP